MRQDVDNWTVRRILEWTTGFFDRKQLDSPRLSAEMLLAHVLGVARIRLYTDYQRPLGARELDEYRALVKRAGDYEPIAYLTGKAPFFNLDLAVNRDVLIPRPDTETLVEQAIQTARHQPGLETPRILDLCTGSGCIAAALAANLKGALVLATDLSLPAVDLARANIEKLGLSDRVHVEVGDLYDALAKVVDLHPFDMIVANPPYIPTAQIAKLDRNVRDYEPLSALDGGPDGLTIHRRILAGAPERLVSGGRIFLEIQFDQGPAAMALIAACDAFDQARILKDYAGHDRVLTARRK